MKKKKNNIYNILMIIAIVFIIIVLFLLTFKSKKTEYKINLVGDKYITLYQDEVYVEPGFTAYKDNELVTDSVIVTNEIKNSPGIYRVLYQIDDYYEYRYIEIKEAIDYNLDITLEANTEKLTNKNISIGVTVNGDTFYSLTLPDGKIVYNNITSYEVEENGYYKFEARNTKNEVFVKEINIDNIDKVSPTGSCVATLNNSNTSISVTTNEDNLSYQYYENNNIITVTSDKNYITNNKTSENIKVVLEDEATNTKEINCQIIDKRYHEQIKPYASDKIIYQGNSETLKVYIVHRGSYHMTYIWVKDAYTQLNKFDSPQYGSRLYVPRQLLTDANKTYNLHSKIMVGFNASGFYLRDTYDAASVNAYGAYDKTSVGSLVITNGKVVRNAYNHAVKTWYTIGVNKENKLLVFEDKKSNNVSEKQAWAQSVINSGIRNTFTFAAPVILNGQRTTITTSMPGAYADKKGLQMICQINENNFLLFTSKNETRNNAINEFLKMGCQTAMNLDGGGSVALFYKEKNTDNFTGVLGGGRSLPEVGYFTE